jgi:hypothetical protein
MRAGPFRLGTGASCLGLRYAATTVATVWIAELEVIERPGRCDQPRRRDGSCRVMMGAILPRGRNSAPHLRQSEQAGGIGNRSLNSVPPLFRWRCDTGFGAFVEFGRKRDHALNQGADFWNDGLQPPHFREVAGTNILFLPLVELSGMSPEEDKGIFCLLQSERNDCGRERCCWIGEELFDARDVGLEAQLGRVDKLADFRQRGNG